MPDLLLSAFVIFCRVGGCLMVMPGYASPRVSMQVRLFIALSASLAVAPLMMANVLPVVSNASTSFLYLIILSELMIGIVIGIFGRAFFAMLQMLMGAAANASSFSMPAALPEDNEQIPPLAGIVTLSATAMLFISGAHLDVFLALAESYAAVPVQGLFMPDAATMQLADRLTRGALLALRITAPFFVFGIIINLALGLTNRLMPQMPVYFVGLPLIVIGGVFVLYLTISEMISLFFNGLGTWLMLE
ncbi:flagellar biosynthetic protein FliR [Pseudovibrio exalbescens]|uniref:flagellar biosynthetic protein FliR n=1 Tax=Pseudovibrio exalbescens TaxID=197461 RepID=UPI002365CFF6|nr:flagellar biosynthetic protein FliR [Pseudovibrio exalbescens]MDD7908995.1 flagellar biosynthetic protein FliR [Pseudovibrio exalbescens]